MTPQKNVGHWREQFEDACLESEAAGLALLDQMKWDYPNLAAGLRASISDFVCDRDENNDALESSTLFGDCPPIPEFVDHYQLLRRIGVGGMSDVFLAKNMKLGRHEAIKMVRFSIAHAHFTHLCERVRQEAAILAGLNNINIVRLNDMGTLADQSSRPWMAMDYINGLPLVQYADQHRLTIQERVGLLIQVCDGISHAHQMAIIHGDLKPSNILVEEHSGRPVVKIIDFGIAHLLDNGNLPHLNRPEYGTPLYMHPGRLHGEIDVKCDLYSLGVILYELLTSVPHPHMNEMKMLK